MIKKCPERTQKAIFHVHKRAPHTPSSMRRCLYLGQCTGSQSDSLFGVTWSPTCAVSKNIDKRQQKTADCFRTRFRLSRCVSVDCGSRALKNFLVSFITHSVYSAAVDLVCLPLTASDWCHCQRLKPTLWMQRKSLKERIGRSNPIQSNKSLMIKLT